MSTDKSACWVYTEGCQQSIERILHGLEGDLPHKDRNSESKLIWDVPTLSQQGVMRLHHAPSDKEMMKSHLRRPK